MRQIVRYVLFLLLFTSAVSTPMAGGLYKSVGPNGVVSYSDQPPTDTRKVETINFNDLPITVMPAFNKPPPTIMERMRNLLPSWNNTKAPVIASGVVLYTASWCGYCKQAKAYLESKSINYKEIDVDTNDGKASFAQAGGGKGVPLIVVAGKNVSGFSTAAYDALFAK